MSFPLLSYFYGSITLKVHEKWLDSLLKITVLRCIMANYVTWPNTLHNFDYRFTKNRVLTFNLSILGCQVCWPVDQLLKLILLFHYSLWSSAITFWLLSCHYFTRWLAQVQPRCTRQGQMRCLSLQWMTPMSEHLILSSKGFCNQLHPLWAKVS